MCIFVVLSAIMLSHKYRQIFVPITIIKGFDMSSSRRTQRVLAEKNYNQDQSTSYIDYGFRSESDMHIKLAQLNAINQYGINKQAFIAPMIQGVKNAFTAGQTAAQAAGTSGLVGGLKSVGQAALTNAKTVGQNAINSVKNPIVNTYQGGVAQAASTGTNQMLGGAKALGKAAWDNPYGQAAMVSGGIGALTSAMTPVQEGESRLGNMARGAVGGAATGAAFVGLQKGMTALGNKAFNAAPPVASSAPVAPSAPPVS